MSMVDIMKIVCLVILLSSWVVGAQDSMGPVTHHEASDEDQSLIGRHKKRLLNDKTQGKTTTGQKLVREAETRNLETYTRLWSIPSYRHSTEGEGKSSESIDSGRWAYHYGSRSHGRGKSEKSKGNGRGTGSSTLVNRWRFWDNSRNGKQGTGGRTGRIGSNPHIVPNPSGSGSIFKRAYLVGASSTPAPDSSKDRPTVGPGSPISSPVSAPNATPNAAPNSAPVDPDGVAPFAPAATPVAQTPAPQPDTGEFTPAPVIDAPTAPIVSVETPISAPFAPSVPFGPSVTLAPSVPFAPSAPFAPSVLVGEE